MDREAERSSESEETTVTKEEAKKVVESGNDQSEVPSSLHSATLLSICSLTSKRISPISPVKRAKNPCILLLMTSISCSITQCTISLHF